MPRFKNVLYSTNGNFANCGNFLEFLKDYSEQLYYLDLKTKFRKNLDKTTLYIYENNSIVYEKNLLTLPSKTPGSLIFLQHLFFFVNIIQALIIVYTKRKFKKIDIAVTTFSVVGLATILGRSIGMVKKTLIYHWDWMPLPKNSSNSFLLKFIDPLDHLGIKWSDYVWYATYSQLDIRAKIGHIEDLHSNKHKVVHWANTTNIKKPKNSDSDNLKILFLGSLLPEKGLIEFFNSIPEIYQYTKELGKDLIITVAGHANDSKFKKYLTATIKKKNIDKYVNFVGYVEEKTKEKLLRENHIGVALYPKVINGVKNYAYYSDPAKLRDYISYGMPILMTDVPEISKDLEKNNAALIVKKLEPSFVIKAIKKYLDDPNKYLQGAYNFSKTDNYKEYYKKHLDSL